MNTRVSSTPAPGLEALARSVSSPSPPVIPRPPMRWRTRVLLPVALLVTLVALLAYAGRQTLWAAVDVTVVPVVVRAGTEMTATGSAVQAAGWVEADPYPNAVSALTDGVVKEVLVLEGQPVSKGQVVARLIDDEARLALTRAEADLAQREADLLAAQREWEHPIEQDRAVAAGEAMVAEAQGELVRLDAEVRTESARVDELADQLSRMQESFKARATSEIEFVGVRFKLQTQRAVLEAVTARRAVLEAQLRQRQADLRAAQENRKLRIQQSRELEAAKAAVAVAGAARDDAKLRLARTEIRSPADGVVLARLVEPGSKLMFASDHPDSATAVRLFDPQHLQVRVDVPLADAAKVGADMEAEIVVSVLPDQTFEGVVTRIVQAADVSKNTLQVKVAIRDPAAALKPEMLARVRFLPRAAPTTTTSSAEGQLIFAPESLIQSEGGAIYAWTVDRASQSAQRRQVQVGSTRREGWVSIALGLNAGDQLIADPSAVREGTRVRVTGEADMTFGGSDVVH